MSESIQTQGKTVNDAVSEALLQLGLRRDEVEIKVIEEPKSGLLGFIGSRPAKVLVRKKPERRRGGRGRDHKGRYDDDQAHTLGTGDGRGRRGRSRKRDDQADGNRQQARGRGDGRRGDDATKDSEEGRRGGRSRRGGRGRGRDNERQGNERRASAQVEAPDSGRDKDTDKRADNASEAKRTGRSRRGSRGRGRGRGRGRNADQDQQQTRPAEMKASVEVSGLAGDSAPQRSERSESRSRRDESGNEPPRKTSRSRREGPAAEAAADETRNPNPNRKVTEPMTEKRPENTPAPTPAADKNEPAGVESPSSAAPTPAPQEAVKPVKKTRSGWGGALGARLPRRENPAIKTRKPVEVLPDGPQPPPPAASGSREAGRGRPRASEANNRSFGGGGYGHEEVIVSEVPATKYARAIGDVTEENLGETLTELTNGMLARAGFPCEVDVLPGEYRQVRISTGDEDDAGILIGRHGQTIDAVEHLVERMASNAIDDRVRMNLDINAYRERREESLSDRVNEAIAEVKETGRPYHAEPMSARERRVIHLQVAEIEGVTTYTVVGSGGKHVVIALEDEGGNGGGDGDELD